MRSGSHSWGTRPHLRPAESLFQQRSPLGIPRRPGPLLPRRGGEGQPGGAPTQKPMEAAPEAHGRQGWRWGQALAASPGCHSGRSHLERASVCPAGPRAARPAVRRPELPPALRHPGRSRWVQAESRGTGRDSPAGPQPAGSDPHVGQNPGGREGQTLDLRVGRSGTMGGRVCCRAPGAGLRLLRVACLHLRFGSRDDTHRPEQFGF